MVPGAGDSTRVQNMKNRLSSDTYPQFWPKQRIGSKVCMYQTRGVLDYIWKLLWTLNYWKRNNSSDYLSEDQQEWQLRPEVIKKVKTGKRQLFCAFCITFQHWKLYKEAIHCFS